MYLLESLLLEILALLPASHRRPHIIITVREPHSRLSIKGGNKMGIVLTDTQFVELGPIQAVDARGNPARIDGAPAWSVSAPELISLTVSADGLSATAAAAGPLGSAQIIVKADADLGEGVTEITGTLDVEVIAGQAVGIRIPAGQPAEAGQ
jgi:hypothetical protein